jgi:hypothetical protein
MPNSLAFLALFAWPVVAYVLFRRMPPHRAMIWTVLAGYLLLPEKTEVDLPLLPALDKTFVPAAAALLLCWPALRARGGLGLFRGIMAPLVLLYLLGPFATVLANDDPFRVGPRVLPGQELYDAFSFGLGHAVLLLPFLLARRLLTDEAALRDLLLALAVAGIAYSLPALFEIRMSPQLHRWIYGFFPHNSFLQQMRYGGFRPVVFLDHGLQVAMFFTLATLAAAALWRLNRIRDGLARGARMGLATLWLLGVLVLCKTLSAFAILALTLPAVMFFRPRPQALVAAAIGLAALLYPMLRGADLAPVGEAMEIARGIDPARAESLGYRIDNEDLLLAHAAERPLLGWGGWGRNRVYDEFTGEDVSVTDGRWIIVVGVYGWLGYVAEFGLLALPLILAARRRALALASPASLALGLILAANLIDLIPNASLTPITWLIAGALAGRLEQTAAVAAATRAPLHGPEHSPAPAPMRGPPFGPPYGPGRGPLSGPGRLPRAPRTGPGDGSGRPFGRRTEP